jgi:hypothetical protein
VAHLHHVRDFLAFLADPPRQVGPDTLSEVTVAVHELMENAIKYARGTGATLELRCDSRHADRIVVRTVNRATVSNARRALSLIARLLDNDARAVYQQVLKETLPKQNESGLGLIRIAAECGMTLNATFKQSQLAIEAWSNPARHASSRSKASQEIRP